MQHALIASAIVIVYGLVLHFAGLSFEKWAQYSELVPFIVLLFINANAYSKANNEYVTYGNVFGSGFKTSMIVGVILAIWGVISIFMFPEIKERAMEQAEQDMLARDLPEEQVEMSLQMTRDYFSLFGGIFLFLFYAFWGTVFSLISAAVVKKKGELPPGVDLP